MSRTAGAGGRGPCGPWAAMVGGCFFVLLATNSPASQPPPKANYDVVLTGGTVIDPESGLHAVRNVGVRGARIERITAEPLTGRDVVDVSGLVVAPGFIDLHAHGQNEQARRLQAQDGVTTALDLEAGAFPVEAFYAQGADASIINFGVSVSYVCARIKLKHDIDCSHRASGDRATTALSKLDQPAYAYASTTPEEEGRLVAYLS